MTASRPAQAPPPRLDSLTGVRAVAVALVFWHHAAEFGEGTVSSGMVGVSLFYILSGFVMAWTDRPGDTAREFYRRRFARIYPAYFVAVSAGIGMLLIAGDFAPTDLAAFTLLQSWVPDPNFYHAANAVFWSLSCEVFFYLAYPLIRKALHRLTDARLWALALSAAVISISVAAIGSFFPYEGVTVWAVVAFPLARIPEFVVGACLGTLMAAGWTPRIPILLAFGASAAAVLVALFVPAALARYAITLVPFAVLVVALASADLRGNKVFTQWPWVVKIGVWSYCFYLIHLMVLAVVIRTTNALGLPVIIGVALSGVVALLGAWLLHIVVERPAESLLRPRGRPRLDSDAHVNAKRDLQ